MRYLNVLPLSVSIIFIASCGGPEHIIRQNDEVLLKMENCKLQVPNNVKIIVDVTHLIDIDSYTFKYHDKEILFAYFGGHPSLFEGADEKYPDEEGIINGMRYKAFHVSRPDGQKLSQVDGFKLSQFVIEIPKLEKEWWRRPRRVNFWYLDLSAEEEKIAIQIIHSLNTLDEE